MANECEAFEAIKNINGYKLNGNLLNVEVCQSLYLL